MDTIFALSSGPVPAGVAVIRISGSRSRTVLEALAGEAPEARRASLRRLRSSDGEAIDEALVIWMPGPGTFTGEDCAELHCHGSRAVVARIVESVAEHDGVRAAEAGEFARRAFLNGRLDLTAAEGLADLVTAETEAQRRQALAQASGAMSERLSAWRERLIGLLGEAEAHLDFSDEDDVGGEMPVAFWEELRGVHAEAVAALSGAGFAERVRDGFRIVITGPPNAGKSTLLNAFARRDVAIVSAEPGTTRDLVSVDLSIAGYPVTLFDTAGLRETPSDAESQGVARALRAAADADLVLRVSAAGLDRRRFEGEGSGSEWLVETKADLVDLPTGEIAEGLFRVSAMNGRGLRALEDAIACWVRSGEPAAGPGGAVPVNERQRLGVADLVRRIESVLERQGSGQGSEADELLAEELRGCVLAVGRVSGRVDAEEVLDAVFSRFCIGK